MRMLMKLLIMVFVLFISGCFTGDPDNPSRSSNHVYTCINGTVYVLKGQGLAPLYKGGKNELTKCNSQEK